MVADQADMIRNVVTRLLESSDGENLPQDGDEAGLEDAAIVLGDDEDMSGDEAGEGMNKGPMFISKAWVQGRWGGSGGTDLWQLCCPEIWANEKENTKKAAHTPPETYLNQIESLVVVARERGSLHTIDDSCFEVCQKQTTMSLHLMNFKASTGPLQG